MICMDLFARILRDLNDNPALAPLAARARGQPERARVQGAQLPHMRARLNWPADGRGEQRGPDLCFRNMMFNQEKARVSAAVAERKSAETETGAPPTGRGSAGRPAYRAWGNKIAGNSGDQERLTKRVVCDRRARPRGWG
ncbi:hypothetical protein Q5P01_024973 [Channa striata]|uniref:Uncharacterized protein n=1 Tax=Channa striata TaxID=64152 RepID=A0AA88IT92_CHASR|nr:hypothetical protein Q5P01_024973 [Channa striata]